MNEQMMNDPGMMDMNSMMAPVMPEEGMMIKPDLGPDSIPDNGDYQYLVDYCIGLYEKFEKSEYRKDKIAEITQSRRIYEQKEDPAKVNFPWDKASNLTLPFTAITVDNLEPRLVSGLVGTKPVVRFEMEGVTDKDDITKSLELWFNQELEQKVQIETRTMGIVHDLLLEGTIYGIPKYDRDEVTRRDFVFAPDGSIALDMATGKPVTQDFVDAVFEGGKFEAVPFTDVFCADDLGSTDEWEKADKIRRIRPTYGELMRNKNSVGYLPDKIGPYLLAEKDKGEKTKGQQTPSQEIAGVKYTGKEVIECIECYVTYQINKDETTPENEQFDFTEDKLFVTICLKTKTLIRIAYLRDINFTNESIVKRMRLYPEEGRSYGTSIYGKIKSIQDGSSDFFNAVLNIAYIVMLPWFFYDDRAGMRKEIVITPGKGVPVDSTQGILFPNFNINPASYLTFIEMFIGLWERSMSVANPQIGRPDDTGKTATEIMMVVQEGNIKFDYQAKTMKEEYVCILKTLYDLYYQHMPYDATLMFKGQPVPFPRQLMKRNFKFLLSGSTATANKMIERKEAEDLLMMSAQNPLMNPMTVLEDVLKSRGKVDLNRYINPQARMMVEAMIQNPEVPQVVGKYLQTKLETQTQVTGETPNGPIQRPAIPGVPG